MFKAGLVELNLELVSFVKEGALVILLLLSRGVGPSVFK